MEMFDEEAEQKAVQFLFEENRVLGHKSVLRHLAASLLNADDFWGATPKTLFKAVHMASQVGLATVLEGSPDQRKQFRAFLDTEEVLSEHVFYALADRLRKLTLRRRAVAFAKEVIRVATNEDSSLDEVVAAAVAGRKAVMSSADASPTLGAAIARVEQHVRDVADGKKRPVVKTGFAELDDPENGPGGLPATLVVIAAMPGVGKSGFEASLIRNLALRGEKSLLFSMEDRADWLVFRLLAHESKIHQFALRQYPLGAAQWDRFGASVHALKQVKDNILCDDRPSLRPEQVLQAARHAITQQGARCIFLDNMTSMRWNRGQRMDLEIQDFLSDARALADETGVPFVVLSHVKRREGLDAFKAPELTDCSETSAFEKLARLAFGLWMFPFTKEEKAAKKSRRIGVKVLKNTNGRSNTVAVLEMRAASAMLEHSEEAQQGFDLGSGDDAQ